jgi:hypothetical protein
MDKGFYNIAGELINLENSIISQKPLLEHEKDHAAGSDLNAHTI